VPPAFEDDQMDDEEYVKFKQLQETTNKESNKNRISKANLMFGIPFDDKHKIQDKTLLMTTSTNNDEKEKFKKAR